ncbi:MAG: phage conserved hypothetical BR0599 family protein [Candidatus Xenolissoclinum pacificiensis L6]|uniref:Phage conserved hypothetical BR0599 family protein n=1 Tax=Candidatus Xenolissoclinum pacificiensis L6 TaxID=1401685 RepID=W2UYS6_9RICK|nr:MAG: phage conserved hypothetical BR0599 family protein [Candidatus Xenolissoclinum pacificiensis L6]
MSIYHTCCVIELSDKSKILLTDADENIVIDSEVYYSNSGIELSAIEKNNNQTTDNCVISGFLESSLITEQDLISGKYDNCKIEIFRFDHQTKTHYISGFIDSIIIEKGKFTAEIKSLSTVLDRSMTVRFSRKCRANFCDSKCKLQLSDYQIKGLVKQVIDPYTIFSDTEISKPLNYFTHGILEFISGNNKGITKEIVYSNHNTIQILIPYNQKIVINDEYIITAGCDKKITTCANKFQNTINFRGEPFIPNNLNNSPKN